MAPRTPFKIVPATADDIDAVADIAGGTFEDDTHTLLKAHWEGEHAHRDGCKEMLPSLLSNPQANFLVARAGEDGTGDVLGFVVWMKSKAFDEPDAKADSGKAETLPPPPPPVQSESGELGLKELRETDQATMNHYVEHLMPPGTRCRVIVMTSVKPGYQGQGIGSALIKWGTDRADADGVFAWVSSSMGGYGVFEKAGFVEVGRRELRLDDYAQGVKRTVKKDGREEETEWGTYVWRWMRRDPK